MHVGRPLVPLRAPYGLPLEPLGSILVHLGSPMVPLEALGSFWDPFGFFSEPFGFILAGVGSHLVPFGSFSALVWFLLIISRHFAHLRSLFEGFGINFNGFLMRLLVFMSFLRFSCIFAKFEITLSKKTRARTGNFP